jgi:hypothetical protein
MILVLNSGTLKPYLQVLYLGYAIKLFTSVIYELHLNVEKFSNSLSNH